MAKKKQSYGRWGNALRKDLLRLLRRKRPTIYLCGETVTGRGLPTTWARAYIVDGGELVQLWNPDSMRVRRKDGNYYWHHNGWGTSHKFVITNDIGHSAGIKDLGNRVHTEWL